MAFRPAALCLLLLLALPAASAHTAVPSADARVNAVVGLLNEPVSTYAVTGLDVCFYQRVGTTSGAPIKVTNPGDFTASLRAPSGAVHQADVRVPHGRENCLTFTQPLVLTQPGQYTVDLAGSINGTSFDNRSIAAGGQVIDRAAVSFPDGNIPGEADLQERIAGLEARIGELEAHRAAHEDQDAGDGEFASASPGLVLMLGLVGLAALLRRRAA